jgi:PhnB protein
MSTINAYLIFNGNCREAMNFYKDCFHGEMTLETVAGSPMESHWPKDVHNHILHASLVNESMTILASDLVEQNGWTVGNNVTLAIICTSDEEIEKYFERLSHGGTIKYPLHNFYNGKIGGLVDKFGINWFLKL